MREAVWILGGTGRAGHSIASELVERGCEPVLVGRDRARLTVAAAALGADTLVAGSVDAIAAEIANRTPAVVINTIGPFTASAPAVARACIEHATHYIDLANDLAAVGETLALGDAAAAAGATLVTGAGFGVTATESVVVKLCAGRPTPRDVRVDMIPSLAVDGGPMGEALAGTLVGGIPGVDGGGRFQGRRYRDGRLVAAPIGGDAVQLTLPDGARVTTAGAPLGELMAAQRASRAPSVLAASSETPHSTAMRVLLPLVTPLLQVAAVRDFALRRLARVEIAARPRPREHSYGHARVTWSDGTSSEGWLRLGDAQAFTGAVPAEIARRLVGGSGRPGAFTPAALFGPDLAESCGAEYLLPADGDGA
ncbi:saccharopine dehydrogenase NADP-binding domain-containing protein [Tsukamurella soli]|uniref:Saccharopine dehydrogenase NADP-binding domain-containing protein n=1 Tax=Tsukamurella soli TaxID=644556 RepID=A0ABP8KA96_9ACTN